MNEFIAISELVMRIDCNFAAKEIIKIRSNSVIEKICELGPWLKVKYNDRVGWIYPFDKQSHFLLELNVDHDFKLGNVVIIKSNKNVINDEYGKTLFVKQDKKKIYYLVIELLSNPKLIKIKNVTKDNEVFWVKPKDIEKVDLSDPMVNELSFASQIFSAFSGLFTSDSTVKKPVILAGDNGEQISVLNNSTTSRVFENLTDQQKFDADGINWTTAKDRLASFNLTNIRTIFGMPYQYMPIADMRFGNKTTTSEADLDIGARVEHNTTTITNLGAKYAEKIVGRMPLMIIVPGVADFMVGFEGKDRERMLQEMIEDSGGRGQESSFINKFTTTLKGTRASFYNMYPAWSEYYTYVNPMCWAAAKFMGVDMYKLPGSNRTLKTEDWSKALKNPEIQNSVAFNGGCSFYIQSDNQLSENISTSTTQSSIASKVNSVSDQGRELMFLSSSVSGILDSAIGGAQGITQSITSVAQSGTSRAMSAFTGTTLTQQFEKSGGAFNAIMNGINNTIAGSKMLFPELWQDTQFTRNYSIRIKLDSPDNDPLSLYLNIVVPLIHLICLAAPRNMGPTTYASPFLVKAYYQGFFNINMGIIADMGINRGAEGAWTLKNVPTVVEVSMDIKDLFATNLTISKSQNLDLNIITNLPLLDYVANLCGVNINEPDWMRIITLWKTLFQGWGSTWFSNLSNRVVNYIYAGRQNIYQSVLAGNLNPFRTLGRS